MAIQTAERFRTDLLRRGVLLVPVIWGQGTAPQVEKKGFGVPRKAADALPSIGVRCKGSYIKFLAASILKIFCSLVLISSVMCIVMFI